MAGRRDRLCYMKCMIFIRRAACLSLPLAVGLQLISCGPSAIAEPQRHSALPPPAAPVVVRPAPAAQPSESAVVRPAPGAPGGSVERIPQPRGGPEDPPPPRPVAPPPRPGSLPPGQTPRRGIGPPPPEVIHPPGRAVSPTRETPSPTAPAPRRQLRDK